MMRRYVILFVVIMATSLGLLVVSRLPRQRAAAPVAVEAARPMTLDVFQERVVTTPEAVTVGQRVELTVVNHATATMRIELAGYEDRVSVPGIEPDSSWKVTFVADRPGEQFAWIVNGEPRGRLDVTGSHLVEGHR
jgi:hypothetical protein